MDRDDGAAPRRAPGAIVAQWLSSSAALCGVSLVLYVVGASGGTSGWADLLVFPALPVLLPAASPLRDARRAAHAAMILASGIGLVVLGSVARALWGGRVEVPDGALILVGTAVLVVAAARRCLGEGEAAETDARRSVWRQSRAPRAASRSAGVSPGLAHGRRAA